MRYLLIFVVLLFMNSCKNREIRLKIGQRAPAFSLYTPEKQKISIENYEGKYLLIHFWADWCAQCRAEFPKLEKTYQKLHEQNFEIIAVNAGQTGEHVFDFVRHYNLTFPMVMDEDLRISEKYGVSGLPTNYFITDKGIIYRIIIGWVDYEQIYKILKEMKSEEF